MSFELAVVTCFQRYATFQGRASRAEFWWWQLFQLLLLIFIAVLSSLMPVLAGWLFLICFFGLIVPTLAVMVRRLHDVGWSGLWMGAGLVGIGSIFLSIVWAWPGQPDMNRFGPPNRPATPRVSRIPFVRRR
ncbi:MAG: DUF805 domain-containing protein [Roseovarius sp.]